MRITGLALGVSLFLTSLAAQNPPTQNRQPSSKNAGLATRKPVTRKSSARNSPAAKAKDKAKAARLRRAFVSSTTLRPMAQQLLQTHSPAAYLGVERYAAAHAKTPAGALAWLVLGYARQQDKNYPEAINSLSAAKPYAGELGDYASWLLATAFRDFGRKAEAAQELAGFGTRFPGSILEREAVVIRAGALLDTGDPATALKELQVQRGTGRADVEFLAAKAYEGTGDLAKAVETYQHVYYDFPTSWDAGASKGALALLATKTAVPPVPFARRMARAQALLSGKRYPEATEDFAELAAEHSSEPPESGVRRLLSVSYAAALYKSKQLDAAKQILEPLPGLSDEINAQRLYYLHEIARSKDKGDEERKLIDSLRENAVQSPWRQDALLSAANMYLVRKDYENANKYYAELAENFPKGKYGGYSHWKTAWLNVRADHKDAAKKLLEDQVEFYPTGTEVPAALYWRGRLAEEEKDLATASAYYGMLMRRFQHYYYADLTRERLKNIPAGGGEFPALSKIPPPAKAPVFALPPADDPRFEKSKLLANGALYDFAAHELQPVPGDSSNWKTMALAQLFRDGGQYNRALETIKRAVPSYFSLDIDTLPREQWEILFPLPYWDELKRSSATYGLDPYLMASLIRQESEFNPGAISSANAYGLMQLLPSVGKQLAKQTKIHNFETAQLTDPIINIQLGTRYVRQLLDKYNGQIEYVLAAYNAGSDRVDTWRKDGSYRDVAEFVESIPFTETREYVQAIMRNASMYKGLYGGRQP